MSAATEAPLVIEIAGRPLTIRLRRSARARRLSLRIDAAGDVVAVLPPGIAALEAERFALAQRDWLTSRLAATPDRVVPEPGATVPLLGIPHRICHDPAGRRTVTVGTGELHVGGPADMVPRRVLAFLRREAGRILTGRAAALAARIGRTPERVSVRDTRSRWGSCSSTGGLSFSWRLVMAPDWVLTYVVAHEVAHLAEMNHGPAFWTVVHALIGDPIPARAWLKRHGPALHRIG